MSERKVHWEAPGRVNIIGEHTDYNDGFVLPIAVPRTVKCMLSPREDAHVTVTSAQHPDTVITLPLDDLTPGYPGGWSLYPLGVVYELLRQGYSVRGCSIYVDGDVPAGAGLSSSAALECSVALAFNEVYSLGLSKLQLIELARRAENDYVGAPTGIMDQSASFLCTAGHALFLDTRTHEFRQIPFDLHSAGLALLVVDTNTQHALVEGEYASRRHQCESAAKQLGVSALRDVNALHDISRLEDVLQRRVRHVVTENARVLDVVKILDQHTDPRTIGPSLTASHESLRDDFEVSTVQLDTAVEIAIHSGAYGARMVGGGFGGSIIALIETTDTDVIAEAIMNEFAQKGFSHPHTFTVTPGHGAGRIAP